MKKIMVLLLTLTALLSLGIQSVFAADGAEVYVNISNAGEIEVAMEKVSVTDKDSDGKLTINDVLLTAHEELYEGEGTGYEYASGDYGLYIKKLWGIDNGGSYGYYVNNASAMSLGDEVKSGDIVTAFLYKDTAGYSDVYSYFDAGKVTAKKGEEFSVTLYTAGFDENWAPVTAPLADAEILIDGESSGIKTDADGKAVIKIDKRGSAVISAKAGDKVLVPAVCVAEITEDSAQTGEVSFVSAAGALMLLSAAAVLCIKKRDAK